jgi:MYXO-CTERM domain-containing protein
MNMSRSTLRRQGTLVAVCAVLSVVASDRAARGFKPTKPYGHTGIVKTVLPQLTRTASDGSGTMYQFSKRAIDEVADAVAGVDELFSSRGEFFTADAHCDNELFVACSQRVVNIKAAIIGHLSAASPNGAAARAETGRALHTLQDFYSHSNWVELGSTGTHAEMGTSVISSFCAPNGFLSGDRTCGLLFTGTLEQCGLQKLTSGYFPTIPNPDPRVRQTPLGKCGHGFPGSAGINKDDPSRTGHGMANALAAQATREFIDSILDAPGVAGNDEAIRAYMDVGGSLGFVIDDTGSMGEEIAGVIQAVSDIVALVAGGVRQPDRYVLVRFGDPDVGPPFVTDDASALLGAVGGLFASGGGDCPELSMKALQQAIESSTRGGMLFLFTDASAKDGAEALNVVAAARARNITIYAALTGTCSPIDPAYLTVTEETGGQAFLMGGSTAEVASFFDLIEPALEGTLQTLLIVSGTLDGTTPRELLVPVDTTVTRVAFSATFEAFGALRVFRPDDSEVIAGDPDATVTGFTGGSVITMEAPATGMWRAVVEGDAGAFSLSASGNSSIGLEDFAFVELRGRSGHEGLYPIIGQPLLGSEQMARARMEGEPGAVAFELWGLDGAPLKTVTLSLGGLEDAAEDELAGSFTLPDQRFRVYATGTDASGNPWVRAFPASFLGQSVAVELVSADREMIAGRRFAAKLRVTNMGAADTFAVTAANSGAFFSTATPASIDLPGDESAVVDVTIDVPPFAEADSVVEVTIVAESLLSPDVANNAIFHRLVGTDFDGDGVSDRAEQGLLRDDPTFDGNGDGAADHQQGHVASLHSFDGAYYVTLSTDAAHPLGSVAAVDNPSAADMPASALFPIGHYTYQVAGLVSGASAVVTFHTTGGADEYFFYGATPDSAEATWVEFAFDGTTGAALAQETLALTYVDGQRGDIDLVEDGFVTAGPGGPAMRNGAPSADAGPNAVVTEGDTVRLTATGTDPDGDMLAFGWTQLDGPAVALDDAESETPSFVAPEVDEDTVLTFELLATDGIHTSTAVTMTVTVQDGGFTLFGCSCRLGGRSAGSAAAKGVLALLLVGLFVWRRQRQ